MLPRVLNLSHFEQKPRIPVSYVDLLRAGCVVAIQVMPEPGSLSLVLLWKLSVPLDFNEHPDRESFEGLAVRTAALHAVTHVLLAILCLPTTSSCSLWAIRSFTTLNPKPYIPATFTAGAKIHRTLNPLPVYLDHHKQ